MTEYKSFFPKYELDIAHLIIPDNDQSFIFNITPNSLSDSSSESDNQDSSSESDNQDSSNDIKFHKYQSIGNIDNIKLLEKIRLSSVSYDNIKWCVTEKAHGANFSFTTNGIVVMAGKRTSYLNKKDQYNFYHCRNVVKKYKNIVLKLHKAIGNMLKLQHSYSIQVFGELIGGNYPFHKVHSDDNPESYINSVHIRHKYKPVQTEVSYCPHIDFYAFDIYVIKYVGRMNGIEQDIPLPRTLTKLILTNNVVRVEEQRSYLDYNLCIELFEHVGLIYAKPEFIGTFYQCLEYSTENCHQITRIPLQFNLPNLVSNIREGVVLKPLKPVYFNNCKRIIIKHKNKDFNEHSSILKIQHQLPKEVSQEVKRMTNLASSYINKIRFKNLISNEGYPKNKYEAGRLIHRYASILTKDAIKDFTHDHINILTIKPKELKLINLSTNLISLILVREEFNIYYSKYLIRPKGLH
jgi:predicted DNA-binding antitoxin AbrB/MazE fold protein